MDPDHWIFVYERRSKLEGWIMRDIDLELCFEVHVAIFHCSITGTYMDLRMSKCAKEEMFKKG